MPKTKELTPQEIEKTTSFIMTWNFPSRVALLDQLKDSVRVEAENLKKQGEQASEVLKNIENGK